MPEIPECLNRRYQALDELIQELTAMSTRGSREDCYTDSSNDPGIKLMCDFWNILKEDPDCNLTQAVKQRMGLSTDSGMFKPQRITCYMAGKGSRCDNSEDRKKDTLNKIKTICYQSSVNKDKDDKCCTSSSAKSFAASANDVLPLNKVLCNLKEAASFDKKCNARLNDLMRTQKELQDQIQHLEHREKDGIQMLKQADCMWSCMEDTYKKKVAESLERQKGLLKELKEVEASNAKWRKNKKDLDSQVGSITKCHQEIIEKINQKTNDIKCMDMEIDDFKKRIENHKKETEAVKKTSTNKKQASDIKISAIAADISRINKTLGDEIKHKHNREQEGNQYVKEAREDLQKICRVLLQKKLENEDLRAEKDALTEEIELLKQTCEQCQDKCKNKQQSITNDIKKITQEIAEFKVRCLRCHQCTDTSDAKRFCNDCPKCMEERDCIYKDDHCDRDPTADCVCVTVKHKFLDNVFENMYTVLERQSKTGPGKAVADAILRGLKNSRNGKLNADTRKILQDFILNTVKKNLNLTIVGGAVKTRCELDPDTYKQLMICLKQVKAVKPPKVDKGTVAKKECCGRWGGSSECNCPGGPKTCPCNKRAPPPPADPSPCPPVYEKEDILPGEVLACPHKESTSCGPDCAMHAVPSAVGTDIATWRPAPCSESACPYSKNVRAAQCMLGPESLNSLPKSLMTLAPYVPDMPIFEDLITCQCGKTSTKRCTCRGDCTSHPREKMIEEVMGRYGEVSPIQKVLSLDEYLDETTLGTNINQRCICKTAQCKNAFPTNASEDKISHLCHCSSNVVFVEGTDALIEMLRKKTATHVIENISDKSHSIMGRVIKLVPNAERSSYNWDTDPKLKVIYSSKLHSNNVTSKNTSASNSYSSSYESKCNECIHTDKCVGGNDLTLRRSAFEKHICETVNKLMKDVVTPDATRGNTSDIELMTIESFIQKISSQHKETKDNDSFITSSEVEMRNVSLRRGVIDTTKRESSLHNYMKSLINRNVQQKHFKHKKQISKKGKL